MQTILNLLSLIGSLALFLYGMKIMSEGLEKFAGNRLRSILAAMTKNRFMGVMMGILVTALIQSSSATTVMVVSFVNAGLMTLTQSIGVIMGANVGTTVTAWIISAIGFKVNIALFALPLIGLGLPLIFSRKGNRKNIGEFIFGFSFLFMGLNYLQTSATNLNIDVIVANLLSHMTSDSFITIIIFVLVGALVTTIVQASAATMAITLMLFDMHIPGFGFELAAALAMGQNIGTTITAFMASLTANTQAKRAALAHMFFNVFGVIVVLIIFYPFCQFVSWFVEDILHNSNNPLFRLSAFHTFFNIGNTLLLIGFVKQIKELVCKLLPLKEENEEYRLRYISGGLLSTAELSILQARKEIVVFAQRCRKMLDLINGLLNTEKGQEFNSIFTRIEKYEQITDSMDLEIAKYLNQVSEGRLSDDSKMQILQMLRTVSELESIGDSFFNMGRTLNRKREYTTEDFTDKQYEHINNMLTLVKKALDEMVKVVSREEGIQIDYHISYNIENEINNYRNQLKNKNIVDINNNVYSYQIGTFYIDFISECEKLGDYILNVIQSSSGEKLKV
ncbi:MAG: Na/Pi cotransporter family protein [Prevotellaceae bacterium]|nr:Na/Pi cotransporter family protein [Prevotellaceae bacterium]